MNAEIFAALAQLEKERGIPQSYMIEKITQALVAAYKKDKDGYTDNVFVEVKDDDMHMYVQKEVVDDVITPATEITLDAARKISKTAQLGDLVNVDVQTKAFGRIAAQTAKQVIIQGIREAERGMVFDTFSSKEHEILTGTVLRIEPATNDMTIRIGGGNDKTDAMLSASEQVRTEYYHEGDLIRVYVVEVRRSTRGPQVIVSRTHPGLVKRLFELEVPEIASGLVEIKSIAREAGSRTKIAVFASQDGIDPVGACVGTRGARVGAVVNELHGEKMDIIVWSEDPAKFVASALSPADVKSVTVLPGSTKACRVIVPDDQLSLAIGKEGQNARLAARLTGYKIDIKPASQEHELELEDAAAAAEAQEAPAEDAGLQAYACTEGGVRMQKKIPMRQCVGCREMKAKKELVRVVRSPEGDISLDFRGKAPGRGAYLCPQTDCLRKAIKSKALDRGLNCQIPQEIYDLLLARMEAGDHD